MVILFRVLVTLHGVLNPPYTGNSSEWWLLFIFNSALSRRGRVGGWLQGMDAPSEYVDEPMSGRFCDPHKYESVQEIYRFSIIVHYELEVSFCVARGAAVPQSITCIVARD